jgi:hypothetical protein
MIREIERSDVEARESRAQTIEAMERSQCDVTVRCQSASHGSLADRLRRRPLKLPDSLKITSEIAVATRFKSNDMGRVRDGD